MRYPMSVVAVAMVAATALAGCSSADSEHREPPSTEASSSPDKVTEITDEPGSAKGHVGASKDARVTACKPKGDALKVEGSVKNPKKSPQDYRIYVSAMKSSETVGLVQVDVAGVAGGKTKDWSTTIAYSPKDLKCVLRVERFSAD